MNILRPRNHLKPHGFFLKEDMLVDLAYAKEPLGETAVEVARRYGDKTNPSKFIIHKEIGCRTADRLEAEFKFRFTK
jgi:hypothetical protein